MDNKYIVYMHTVPNGKRYIGVTCNKTTRRFQHGSGYKNNPIFYDDIQKYGWDNIKHEILFNNLPRDEAWAKEMELISKYKATDPQFGYNRAVGGSNPYIDGHPSEEMKERIRKKLTGYKHTQEMRERCSLSHLGIKHTEEYKKRMSEARKGTLNPMYGKKGGEKQKEAVKNACGKTVICIETNIVYRTIKEAERQTGINDSSIAAVCKSQRKTAGGYHWEYYNKVVSNV